MSPELIVSLVAMLAAVVAAGTAIVLLLRQNRAASSRDAVARQVEQVTAQVQASGQAQGARVVELQEVLDARLSRISTQSGEDAARRLHMDAQARQELQATLSERLLQMEGKVAEVQRGLAVGLDQLRTTNAAELDKIRVQVAEKLQESLKGSIAENTAKIAELKDATAAELEKVRVNNEAQLEKMRATVDEKLQGSAASASPSSWSPTASSRCSAGLARCRPWRPTLAG